MASMQQLLDIMRKLRDPQSGCPWDVEQDFDSIAPYTIEEAYEVADAIDRKDMDALKDELGDLLFQVVFHAQMASEAGDFHFDDVVEAVCDKMVRRHPHVFGDTEIGDAEEQTKAWEEHKARERGDKDDSALAGVVAGLPEWIRCMKLHKRAARVGFDWTGVGQVLEKLDEEVTELREAVASDNQNDIEDEFGDLLFVCSNIARHAHVDPSRALRRANRKFERRFRRMEALVRESGGEMKETDMPTLDRLWDQAKEEERSA